MKTQSVSLQAQCQNYIDYNYINSFLSHTIFLREKKRIDIEDISQNICSRVLISHIRRPSYFEHHIMILNTVSCQCGCLKHTMCSLGHVSQYLCIHSDLTWLNSVLSSFWGSWTQSPFVLPTICCRIHQGLQKLWAGTGQNLSVTITSFNKTTDTSLNLCYTLDHRSANYSTFAQGRQMKCQLYLQNL